MSGSIKAGEKTRFGLTYLSPVDLDFEDTPSFTGLGPGLSAVLASPRQLNLGMTVPQSAMLGVYRSLNDKWAVMGDFGWQNWKQFGYVQAGVESGGATTLNLKYQDTWHGALGAQYRASEKWLFSAGVAFEIASNRPGWFARNLLSRDDWKATLRSIVKGDLARFIGKRGGLKDIISNLEDGEDKKKLMDAIKDIENEERMDSEKLSEFFKDPSKGLEGIEGIYDLCHMMGPIHLDNRFDILISWLTKEPDKKKATILFHFMNHCDGAYHMELMADLAMDFFLGHMPLVVSALKENKNWRWIVLFVSHWLRDEDGEFKSTISNLGNTEFEMKIRAQLEFLRDHFSY